MISQQKMRHKISHRIKTRKFLQRRLKQYNKWLKIFFFGLWGVLVIMSLFTEINNLILFTIASSSLGVFVILAITPIIIEFRLAHVSKRISEAIVEYVVKPNFQNYNYNNLTVEYGKHLKKEDSSNISEIYPGRVRTTDFVGIHIDGIRAEIYWMEIFKFVDVVGAFFDYHEINASFDGVCIILPCSKILPKNRILILNTQSITDMEKILRKNSMYKVETESSEFNENFCILSDRISSDIQYLLPPDTMMQLLKFCERYDRSISVYYASGKLYIMLHGVVSNTSLCSMRNLVYKISYNKDVSYRRAVDELTKEINTLTEIIREAKVLT